MESKLYVCLRCGKSVKSITGLIRHVNACTIPNSLPYCQSLNSKPMLNYNKTNPLDLPSKKHKQDISLKRSNNCNEKIRPANMDNNEENIRPLDIKK